MEDLPMGATHLSRLESILGPFHQQFMRSFYMHSYKKRKKDWRIDCIFAFLGFMRLKAARKMLLKSTPGLHKLFMRQIMGENCLSNDVQCNKQFWRMSFNFNWFIAGPCIAFGSRNQ